MSTASVGKGSTASKSSPIYIHPSSLTDLLSQAKSTKQFILFPKSLDGPLLGAVIRMASRLVIPNWRKVNSPRPRSRLLPLVLVTRGSRNIKTPTKRDRNFYTYRIVGFLAPPRAMQMRELCYLLEAESCGGSWQL